MMDQEKNKALRTARSLLGLGHPLESFIESPVIPEEYRDYVREQLQQDRNIILKPIHSIVVNQNFYRMGS